MRPHLHPAPLSLLLAALTAAPALAAETLAPPEAKAPQRRALTLREPLAPGGTLTLELVRAQVRAEPSTGTEVELLTTRVGRKGSPDAVELRLERSAQGLRFWDRYPRLGWRPSRECLPQNERGDFWSSDVVTQVVVRVPRGVTLRVRLMDGDIDVRHIDGPRDVSTNTGTVLGVPRLSALLN